MWPSLGIVTCRWDQPSAALAVACPSHCWSSSVTTSDILNSRNYWAMCLMICLHSSGHSQLTTYNTTTTILQLYLGYRMSPVPYPSKMYSLTFSCMLWFRCSLHLPSKLECSRKPDFPLICHNWGDSIVKKWGLLRGYQGMEALLLEWINEDIVELDGFPSD